MGWANGRGGSAGRAGRTSGWLGLVEAGGHIYSDMCLCLGHCRELRSRACSEIPAYVKVLYLYLLQISQISYNKLLIPICILNMLPTQTRDAEPEHTNCQALATACDNFTTNDMFGLYNAYWLCSNQPSSKWPSITM